MRTCPLLTLSLLAAVSALAFPPAPHHTLFGVVKNRLGNPLKAGEATLILSGPNGEVMRAPVDPSIATGINYTLQVALDSNRTPQLYLPTAMLPASPYSIRVVIGSVSYLPIQMQGQVPTLGAAAGSTRVDLTLGEDSDGDGLPDAWEQDVIDFDPDDNLAGLADVKPGDDSDGDGMTNLAEYIAGTYAFDKLDALNLEVKAVANQMARLEFVTVTGRTYHLSSSVDGVLWQNQPFSLAASGGDPAVHHLAARVTLLTVWVPVGTEPKTLFRLYVE